MHQIRLTRDEQPISGLAFVAIPMGIKKAEDGSEFDFDWLYNDVISQVIAEAGMKPVRADSVYGPATMFDVAWRGIQQAELAVVDFSGKNPNVAMEYMAARILGKRMVYLAQRAEDIPSDVRGLRYIPYSALYADMSRMREELKAQLEAVRQEPAQEMALIPMATGGTVPVSAKVISVSPEFAVVRADDGAHGVLSGEDVDWGKLITDMTQRFKVGDRVDGAFETRSGGGMRYTLLAGRPNPWKSIAANHLVGSTFTGTVHSVRQVGVFVRIEGPVNGLIPRSMLPQGAAFVPGEQVEVTVVEMEPHRRRITLGLARGAARRPAITGPGIRVGMRLEGEVVKVAPEGQGGYLLLTVPGRQRPVFMHCTAMTSELRRDLNAGGVELGELIDVEVVAVDRVRDRVSVKDLPESGDEAVAA